MLETNDNFFLRFSDELITARGQGRIGAMTKRVKALTTYSWNNDVSRDTFTDLSVKQITPDPLIYI